MADGIPEGYESAEVSAAKNIAWDVLDSAGVADETYDLIEIADTLIERLVDAGVTIPETIVNPFTGKPANTPGF